MKKLMVLFVAAVTALCASAQGNMAIGVDLGAAPCLEKNSSWNPFGLGAKLQFDLPLDMRLDANIDYWFKDKGLGFVDAIVNVDYVVPVAPRVAVYPLAGIGFGRTVTAGDDVNRFIFNVGIGGELKITGSIKAFAEIKYQYVKDLSRMPIQVGIMYNL